jgi:hypothetical protein
MNKPNKENDIGIRSQSSDNRKPKSPTAHYSTKLNSGISMLSEKNERQLRELMLQNQAMQ